jgi:hypothetical protein
MLYSPPGRRKTRRAMRRRKLPLTRTVSPALNGEISRLATRYREVRIGKAGGPQPIMMHGREKSKSANKGGRPPAEPMEQGPGPRRTWSSAARAEHRVGGGVIWAGSCTAAKERKKERFTALLHHAGVDLLRHAHRALPSRTSAAWSRC